MVKLPSPEVAFQENRLFLRSWTLLTHNFQTRQIMSFLLFRASLLGFTCGKNFMVIRSVVSVILGDGVFY